MAKQDRGSIPKTIMLWASAIGALAYAAGQVTSVLGPVSWAQAWRASVIAGLVGQQLGVLVFASLLVLSLLTIAFAWLTRKPNRALATRIIGLVAIISLLEMEGAYELVRENATNHRHVWFYALFCGGTLFVIFVLREAAPEWMNRGFIRHPLVERRRENRMVEASKSDADDGTRT